MTPHQEAHLIETVTRIDTRLELLIANGGSKGLVPDLRRDVNKHEGQINRWKGALGVIVFLLLLVGGTEIWHLLHFAK